MTATLADGDWALLVTASSTLSKMLLRLVCAAAICFGQQVAMAQQGDSAAGTLLHPLGVVIDASTGTMYFAERDAHRIRKLTSAGSLETVAGTGVQGSAGDGGLAVGAQLNSPEAVALDGSGDLYIADTGNHRIRRVDTSGIITTAAGSGAAGFAGDGGPATGAMLSQPRALAIDKAGNLLIVDTGNRRLRRVDAQTGSISTLAGDGWQGTSATIAAGSSPSFDEPTSVAIDANGNIYIADAGSQRIYLLDATTHHLRAPIGPLGGNSLRPSALAFESTGGLLIAESQNNRVLRADVQTGTLSVLAGAGAQAFSGDGADARGALLNEPSGVAGGPDGSVVVADSANNRLRTLSPASDLARVIQTVAGVGASLRPVLVLTGPASTVYGDGAVQVSLAAGGGASGLVTLRDVSETPSSLVGTATLTQGVARLSVGSLFAGAHRLLADYSGDSTHPPSTSSLLSLTVVPLPVSAVPLSAAMLYGQPTPALTGSVSGILSGDAARVGVAFYAQATSASSPGDYPIGATLNGIPAANYTVAVAPALLTISRAPVTVTLASAANAVAVRAASSTTGVPTGTMALLDAGVPVSSGPLGNDGVSTLDVSQLAAGIHQLQAIYSGDRNFLGALSPLLQVTVVENPPATNNQADFSISSPGGSSPVTLVAGGAVSVPLVLTPSQGSLAGPVILSVSGLPAFASGNFDPPLIPPGDGSHSFTLHIATASIAKRAHLPEGLVPLACGLLLPLVYRKGRPMRDMSRTGVCLCLLLALTGCGDRVQTTGTSPSAPKAITYTVVVTGTATDANGHVLQHSMQIQLIVNS